MELEGKIVYIQCKPHTSVNNQLDSIPRSVATQATLILAYDGYRTTILKNRFGDTGSFTNQYHNWFQRLVMRICKIK